MYKRKVWGVCALAILLSACMTHNVKFDQVPEVRGGSRLSSVPSRTIVIRGFELQPGAVVSRVRVHTYLLDAKDSRIVGDTLAAELKRNGHVVVPESRAKPDDVVIEGEVTMLWLDFRDKMWSVDYTGIAKVKVTIRSGNKTLMSKEYKGNTMNACSGFSFPRRCIEATLVDLVSNMTTDPDFLEALQEK